MTDLDDRRKAFEELMRLSDELGWDASSDGLYCKEHERYQPCRPCLRAEGFYD